VGNVGVGRVGQEALQETVAGPVFRRPPEDHLLRGYAQQPGKQQHHNRHVQPVFRHERLEKHIKSAFELVHHHGTREDGRRGRLFNGF